MGDMDRGPQPTDFAKNLRRLCAETASIADICRDTGINRQQFNKYLAGKSIPSTRILRKICERLGVSESALFTNDTEQAPKEIEHNYTSQRLGKEINRLAKILLPPSARGIRATEGPVQPGQFYCYFAFPDQRHLILRSFIRVWQQKDVLAFLRLTRDRGPLSGTRTTARGRHYGIITSTAAELTLLALNRTPPHQVSMLNFNPAPMQERFWIGLAMTRAATGPVACRAVLERLPEGQETRPLLVRCGILPANDPGIPKLVRGALQPSADNVTSLTALSADAIAAAMVMVRP